MSDQNSIVKLLLNLDTEFVVSSDKTISELHKESSDVDVYGQFAKHDESKDQSFKNLTFKTEEKITKKLIENLIDYQLLSSADKGTVDTKKFDELDIYKNYLAPDAKNSTSKLTFEGTILRQSFLHRIFGRMVADINMEIDSLKDSMSFGTALADTVGPFLGGLSSLIPIITPGKIEKHVVGEEGRAVLGYEFSLKTEQIGGYDLIQHKNGFLKAALYELCNVHEGHLYKKDQVYKFQDTGTTNFVTEIRKPDPTLSNWIITNGNQFKKNGESIGGLVLNAYWLRVVEPLGEGTSKGIKSAKVYARITRDTPPIISKVFFRDHPGDPDYTNQLMAIEVCKDIHAKIEPYLKVNSRGNMAKFSDIVSSFDLSDDPFRGLARIVNDALIAWREFRLWTLGDKKREFERQEDLSNMTNNVMSEIPFTLISNIAQKVTKPIFKKVTTSFEGA